MKSKDIKLNLKIYTVSIIALFKGCLHLNKVIINDSEERAIWEAQAFFINMIEDIREKAFTNAEQSKVLTEKFWENADYMVYISEG